ncbi:MAG: dienelactone hydrolase family protein [Dermatophilaceae bacterium]
MSIVPAAVTVPTSAGDLPARLWLPAGGRGPGIVLCQEIFGVSPYIERRAADLAALGYAVLAPEFYWRIGASGVPNGPDMLAEGLALAQRFDWGAGVEDGAAAYDWLCARPEVSGPVGLVGFCFGGGLAYNIAAVRAPALLVSYYGSALPGLVDSVAVDVPSLHHFGKADSYIDLPTVERIRAAVAGDDVEFYVYPEADHAFDNDDFAGYHEEASTIAWALTEKFLRTYLPA